ncbi:MAG: hypothetical protein RSN88_07225 [Gordonibacter sp.]|uniref:hypothetical protein n=1 Tax=Gordonibacter sp. TaxID=1968902 RepID=UPI002FC7F48C
MRHPHDAHVGTIFAWSIFIPPLEAEFGRTRSQTSLVFSVAMIGLSLGKPANIRLQARNGSGGALVPMEAGLAGGERVDAHVVG